MKSKKFQRRIENFVCKKCGAHVKGSGYTDHCPVCLWGRHADVNPGDRAAECGEMMEPMRAEAKNGQYFIHYKCTECGHEFRVKSAPEDNFDEIIQLINR